MPAPSPAQAANWVVVGTVRRAQPARQDASPTARSRPSEAAELLEPGRRQDAIAAASPSRCSRSCSKPATAPAKIVEERGLKQTSDTGAIDAEIDEILAANADKVEQYKAGKEALFGFFVGQTMKAMAGKANPQVVNERLRAKLG